MISENKAKEIVDYVNSVGYDLALRTLDIKKESLDRYLRLGKQIGLLDGVIEGAAYGVKKARLKVLVFDVETAPARAFVWGFWKQNVAPSQVISDWYMISWSAKWLNDNEIMSDVLTPDEAITEDDYRISKSLHKLIEEADVLIAHNGIKFDIRKINSRFIFNNLQKPSPYQVIDTLQVFRKNFGELDNKLDTIARKFGLGSKLNTEMKLWVDCVNGDEEALRIMKEYNEHDVVILEEVYHAIKGWIPNHPRMYVDKHGDTCEVCGSKELVLNGNYRTSVNSYQSYTCLKCGASLRERVNSDKNNELVVCAR